MNTQRENASLLTAEFESFIEAAKHLESSHNALHAEVTRLRQELEERNSALESSLRQLECSRQMLTRILENLPCGVILLKDSGMSVAVANGEARELLGLPVEGSEQLPAALTRVLSRVDWSRAVNFTDEICVEAERSTRWLSLKTKRVQLSDEPTAISKLLILQDVTAQKELERERERVRNSLALAEMSSVLAHEIRNPLGAMELFLTLLGTQGNLNSEALTWLDHVTAGVRSLSATVNNVLQFYATGTFVKAKTALWPIVRESVEFLQPVATEASIHLSACNCASEVEAHCDADAIRQIILNLCGNALRHSPEGSTVKVSLQKVDGSAVVEVSDRGNGIAPEHLPNVFEAGYSATGRHAGLGLAVCRRIAEAHGGTVKVASTSQSGTTMRLEIPCL